MTTAQRFSNHQPLPVPRASKRHHKHTAHGDRKRPRKRLQDVPAEGTYVDAQQPMLDDDQIAHISETLEGPRHIHPCICDLTAKQRDRIKAYLTRRKTMQLKYEKRLHAIEEELARIEEERILKEREMEEQEELFGDVYEIVGRKKKRMKRSARRASMVSLGVKQVINWRKPPRYPVKPSKTSQLRKEYTCYCGKLAPPESPIGEIDYGKEPHIPVRATISSELRSKVNLRKKLELIKREDNRPRFTTCCF